MDSYFVKLVLRDPHLQHCKQFYVHYLSCNGFKLVQTPYLQVEVPCAKIEAFLVTVGWWQWFSWWNGTQRHWGQLILLE